MDSWEDLLSGKQPVHRRWKVASEWKGQTHYNLFKSTFFSGHFIRYSGARLNITTARKLESCWFGDSGFIFTAFKCFTVKNRLQTLMVEEGDVFFGNYTAVSVIFNDRWRSSGGYTMPIVFSSGESLTQPHSVLLCYNTLLIEEKRGRFSIYNENIFVRTYGSVICLHHAFRCTSMCYNSSKSNNEICCLTTHSRATHWSIFWSDNFTSDPDMTYPDVFLGRTVWLFPLQSEHLNFSKQTTVICQFNQMFLIIFHQSRVTKGVSGTRLISLVPDTPFVSNCSLIQIMILQINR